MALDYSDYVIRAKLDENEPFQADTAAPVTLPLRSARRKDVGRVARIGSS